MKVDEPDNDLEMKDDYDFSGGVRGKHYGEFREGHTVYITDENGVVHEHRYSLEDGAIMLDPDLRSQFPDSDAVNAALRSLLAKAR